MFWGSCRTLRLAGIFRLGTQHRSEMGKILVRSVSEFSSGTLIVFGTWQLCVGSGFALVCPGRVARKLIASYARGSISVLLFKIHKTHFL